MLNGAGGGNVPIISAAKRFTSPSQSESYFMCWQSSESFQPLNSPCIAEIFESPRQNTAVCFIMFCRKHFLPSFSIVPDRILSPLRHGGTSRQEGHPPDLCLCREPLPGPGVAGGGAGPSAPIRFWDGDGITTGPPFGCFSNKGASIFKFYTLYESDQESQHFPLF